MPGGIRKRIAFPRPLRGGAIKDGEANNHERPAPDPVDEKRPPVAGRALAGPLRPVRLQLPWHRVAKAMAFASQT